MHDSGNSRGLPSSILDEARAIVRRHLAGTKVPLYYYVELDVEEQTHIRGKPRPYLAAGIELLRLIGGDNYSDAGGP